MSVLQKLSGLLRGEPEFDPVADVPTIRNQTPWRCNFFDFTGHKADGIDFFNPGLVRRPDGLWLITRRSRWRKGYQFGMNDLMAFQLNENKKLLRPTPLVIRKRFEGEQWEDPRVVERNGTTWVSCCNFIWVKKSWTGAHQIMCQFNQQWAFQGRIDPVYRANGDNIGENTNHEKNWLWFFHNDAPHLVYHSFPHIVARFDESLLLQEEWVTPGLEWRYGEIRGGTPPIRIADQYWSFFHSSLPWKNKKRRYYMGAYTFEARPPFRITRITPTPLLAGSQEDPWAEGKPLVVFAGGAEYRDDKFFVVFGVNDLTCAWIEIPIVDLTRRLIYLGHDTSGL